MRLVPTQGSLKPMLYKYKGRAEMPFYYRQPLPVFFVLMDSVNNQFRPSISERSLTTFRFDSASRFVLRLNLSVSYMLTPADSGGVAYTIRPTR